MLAKILLTLLLLTGTAFAQKDGLTRTNHYYIQAYRILGFDTAGTSFLTQTEMREFVYRAVDQMPAWVHGRELVKQDTISGTRNTIFVDSLVAQVLHVTMLDGDTLRPLKQRPFDRFADDFNPENPSPRFLEFGYFADTIYLYPKRSETTMDTLRILYYQQPTFANTTDTASITVARPFQMGIVLYSVYLAEVRLLRGQEQAAWKRFTDWVTFAQANLVRKPVNLYEGESQR